MALLKKIVEKLQKVHRLGFSNAWFIFKKRCRDRQNRVIPYLFLRRIRKKFWRTANGRGHRLLSCCASEKHLMWVIRRRLQLSWDSCMENSICMR